MKAIEVFQNCLKNELFSKNFKKVFQKNFQKFSKKIFKNVFQKNFQKNLKIFSKKYFLEFLLGGYPPAKNKKSLLTFFDLLLKIIGLQITCNFTIY